MAIECKQFLEMCQKISMLPDGILGIKQNVPDELKVVHNGIVYYPISYQMSFNKGKPLHKAILHSLKSNSIICCRLEDIKKYVKRV